MREAAHQATMGFFSLPIIGNSLLFPTILTSLIVGFVFLILSEKRRVSGGEARSDSKSPAKDASFTGADPKPREKEEGADADVDSEGVERTGSDSGVKGESSSCSSGSEEEAGDKKAKSKRKRKHSCEGAKACSSKKTVSDVVVWTSEGEQSKVLESRRWFVPFKNMLSFLVFSFLSLFTRSLLLPLPLNTYFS